ncbi:MAG TPA: hypothetical protein VFP82_02995 [Chthoniobacterales bacterium]|nr:hypothetical protein [Chthoniobacterales bacterium]
MRNLILAIALSFIIISRVDAGSDVTAAQVNGTWSYRQNEFKILALGQQKLQIEFSGAWEHKTGNGELTANTGEGSGTAKIEGDTAIFKPESAEDECKITLKFTGGKLVVTQEGMCGFGFNVSADGTYKRTSSKKPKFDSE